MAMAFWILAALLAAFLAAVILLIATPVKIDLALRTAPRLRFTVHARALGGAAPAVSVFDSAKKARSRLIPAARPGRKGARSQIGADRLLRAVGAVPALFSGVIRTIRLERLQIDADVGLGDPADTGQLYGFATAWSAGRRATWSSSEVLTVDVRPDFAARRLDGFCEATLSLTPGALAPPFIRFAWRVWGPPS